MKKLLLIAGAFLFIIAGAIAPALLSAQPVHAADVVEGVCNNPNLDTADLPAVCRDNNTGGSDPLLGPDGVITTYIQILSFVVGLFAVGGIILGGLRFVTSSGDPQTVKTARQIVIYSIIGLVVASVAQGIVIFVLSKV